MISSFYCTWIFNKTRGNVLILILLHASVSFAAIFVPIPLILTVLHIVILIPILITGHFFRKIELGINDNQLITNAEKHAGRKRIMK